MTTTALLSELAAIRELFPRCAHCGLWIGDATTAVVSLDQDYRLLHAHCALQAIHAPGGAMKSTVYLIFTKNGITGVRKARPKGQAQRWAVQITLEVPDQVFRPTPIPHATVLIPADSVLIPTLALDVVAANGAPPTSVQEHATLRVPADRLPDPADR